MVVLSTSALAGVVAVDLGTGSPPLSLGGYEMVGFQDARPLGDEVVDVAPPGSATVTGMLEWDVPLEHTKVGQGWDTWSHPYTGDVYWLDEIIYGNTLTLTLPLGTQSFYFYLEPNFFGEASFGVTSGTTTRVLDVMGEGGANGIGFYSDDPGQSLVSITIEKLSADFTDGFGVGEFAINGVATMPDASGGVWIVGMAWLGILGLRWQMRRQG